jgi:hypothetical protein
MSRVERVLAEQQGFRQALRCPIFSKLHALRAARDFSGRPQDCQISSKRCENGLDFFGDSVDRKHAIDRAQRLPLA